MLTRIPFGPWRPDQGEFATGDDFRTWKVYGAVNYGLQWVAPPGMLGEDLTDGSSNFIPSRVYGMHIHNNLTAPTNIYLFVGVHNNILRTAANDLTTTTATGGLATFATAPDTISGWQFTSFGRNVIATQFGGSGVPMQLAAGPTANFSKCNTITGPTSYDPCPRFVSTIKNHLLIAHVRMDNTLGPFTSGTAYPNLVMWSATDNPQRFGDPDNTPSATLLGSDFQHLYDEHGPITGLVGGDYAYIFKPRAIYRMEGPPFTFSPVCVGSGTIYPNSIVQFYSDIYYWGPAGPTRLRGGSSEPEIIGLGKVSRTLTESQNIDFVDFVFEIEPITGVGYTGSLDQMSISGFADYRTGLVCWVVGDDLLNDPAGNYTRNSVVVTYDTFTNEFGSYEIAEKALFAKSVPRYGQNPSPPSGRTAGDLTQHSVMDGMHAVILPSGEAIPGSNNAELAVSYGDFASTVDVTGDSQDEWFPRFVLPYRSMYEDENGPAATRIVKIRMPMSLNRYGAGVSSANCTYELIIRIKSKDNFSDLCHDTGSLTYSMDHDGWAYVETVEAVYHQIDITVKAYEAGANIQRWIAHIKDLKYIDVEFAMGSGAGSHYLTS